MATLGRQKNRNWAVDAPDNWQNVPIVILQDIRDELQALNRVMQCSNVSRGFQALSKIASRDERAFKRRVAGAVAKRLKRSAQ